MNRNLSKPKETEDKDRGKNRFERLTVNRDDKGRIIFTFEAERILERAIFCMLVVLICVGIGLFTITMLTGFDINLLFRGSD